MATKVKVPNVAQLEVLRVLSAARVLRVVKNENLATSRTSNKVEVVTRKENPCNVTLRISTATVTQLEKAGWIREYASQAGSNNDLHTTITLYEITEEGKKARRAS